jgi:hypothetical protein
MGQIIITEVPGSTILIEPDNDTPTIVIAAEGVQGPAGVSNIPGPAGPQGNAGPEQVFVQPDAPSAAGPYLWIETGLAPAGAGFTFWFEDGV